MTREQLKALLPEGTTDEFAPAGFARARFRTSIRYRTKEARYGNDRTPDREHT